MDKNNETLLSYCSRLYFWIFHLCNDCCSFLNMVRKIGNYNKSICSVLINDRNYLLAFTSETLIFSPKINYFIYGFHYLINMAEMENIDKIVLNAFTRLHTTLNASGKNQSNEKPLDSLISLYIEQHS